jgi:hypothetical protein
MVSPYMIILFGTGNKRKETIMKSSILALAFFSLTLPANALDGTPSPAIAPAVASPGHIFPNKSEYWHNPNLLEQARQLQRRGDELLAQANPGGTAGVDPLIGTWKLNLAKSTSTAPLLRSATQTWTREGQTLIDTAEGVDAQGQPFKVVFRHIYDGMPHPTTGSPNYDSTTYTWIGNTINWVRFKQGTAVEVGQAVIVPDKSYTITVEGINANNQPYRNVGVFDRQ